MDGSENGPNDSWNPEAPSTRDPERIVAGGTTCLRCVPPLRRGLGERRKHEGKGMEPQNGFAYHDISIGGPDMVDGLSERRQELHIYSNTGLEDDRRSTSIRTRICATPS
jgi:hypothetical protein